MTRFEEVMTALLARDNMLPSDIELKKLVKSEFLYGAAVAFSACFRGEESNQCLAAALALYDEPKVA
jgi:hypothetical protein